MAAPAMPDGLTKMYMRIVAAFFHTFNNNLPVALLPRIFFQTFAVHEWWSWLNWKISLHLCLKTPRKVEFTYLEGPIFWQWLYSLPVNFIYFYWLFSPRTTTTYTTVRKINMFFFGDIVLNSKMKEEMNKWGCLHNWLQLWKKNFPWCCGKKFNPKNICRQFKSKDCRKTAVAYHAVLECGQYMNWKWNVIVHCKARQFNYLSLWMFSLRP